jgi:four helix bundle protein
MAYKSFEDLEVWQRACRLAVKVFEEFRSCDFINLKNQIERSALSIPSNIAEVRPANGAPRPRRITTQGSNA